MKDREWKIKKPMLFAEKYGILIFPLTAGILFLLQNTSHTIAGSQIDWISQHTVLAEYFRQRFYSTHEFFPQFASELGGGQNIYNFAYYGLQPVGSFVICVPFSFHGSVVSDHGNPDTYGRRSVMFLLAEPPSEEAVQHLWGNGFDVFFCCSVPYLRTGYVCGLPALSSAHADRGGYLPENEG